MLLEDAPLDAPGVEVQQARVASLREARQSMQKQLDDYYNFVIEEKKVPEVRRRPFKMANFNIGRPFYLNADDLNTDEIK